MCFNCQKQLVKHHPSTEVRIYTLEGLVRGEKWSLRCNGCDTTYNYGKYGSRNGWKLYDNERNLVESSDCCYLERKLFNWMGSLRYTEVPFKSYQIRSVGDQSMLKNDLYSGGHELVDTNWRVQTGRPES